MSGNEIFIGNVRFNKNDVAKSSTSTAANGATLYSVFLKNGTKVHFYDQGAGSKAYVMSGRDMGNDQKYGTAFAGIQGMVIEGSQKDDYYHLSNCDYYNIDVRGGGNDEVRVFNPTNLPESAEVKRDSTDNIYSINPGDCFSMSEGFFIEKLNDDNSATPPKPVKNKPNTTNTASNLQPIASMVTKYDNNVREYRDADGNTVVRVDYHNNDPDEFPDEEEVRRPDGRILSFTKQILLSADRSGRLLTKYIYDDNENLVKVLETEYKNGKVVNSKEIPLENVPQLIGHVHIGTPIDGTWGDPELQEFVRARGCTLAGNN